MSAVLPKQVQTQLEEAERIQGELAAPVLPPQPEPQLAPQPQPVISAEPPAPPPAEPVAPAPVEDVAYWRQRFETMQGKYNAEVPRLHDTLRQQVQTVQQMQGRLEHLERSPTPAPAAPAPLITANDEEKFGADLVDMARRVARDESLAVVQRLELLEQMARNLGTKVGRVDEMAQDVQATKERQFYVELAKAVPNWQTINVDPVWLKWLAEFDPFAGKPRQLSLDEASSAMDYQRAIAIFQRFLDTLPAPQPSQAAQAQSELARQVAPTRSSTTNVTPSTPKGYTGTQYTYWFDPRRANDTESATLKANQVELEKAQVEGRIDWAA